MKKTVHPDNMMVENYGLFSDNTKVAAPDFGEADAYPNPFQDQINADIQLKTETVVRVETFDVSGKLLYSDYKGTVPAGPTTLRVTPGSEINASGIYIMCPGGKNGESRIFKLVKR